MANNNNSLDSTLNPKKTIKLNPVFLKLNKTKKLYKKEKPTITTSTNDGNGGNGGNGGNDTISPSIIKKKIYKKINSYKNKTIKNNKIKKNLNNEPSNNLDNDDADDSSNNLDDDTFNIEKQKKEFNIEFNKSLDFLQSLSKKHKKEKDKNRANKQNKNKNTTLKQGKIENEIQYEIATELPEKLLFNPYDYDDANANTNTNTNTKHQSVSISNDNPKYQSVSISNDNPILKNTPSTKSTPNQMNTVISTPIQSTSFQQPYSNLRNGSKPTFREWKHNQTQKKYHNEPNSSSLKKPLIILNDDKETTNVNENETNNANINNANINNANIIMQRREALASLKKELIGNKNDNKNDNKISTPKLSLQKPKQSSHKKRTITTRTLKYKLGKNDNKKKIGILIKNSKTRKRIQHEYSLLKQKPINEVKNYLRNKNLLKVGSSAPNDVLRQLYEQSILSGDIENKASDVLFHNYMNNK